VGRYWNISGNQVLYYALSHHYTGDIVQMTHVWVSTGYNHTDIEGWAEDQYVQAHGWRQQMPVTKTWRTTLTRKPIQNARQNRYNLPVGNVHKLIVEQAFNTYLIRFRSGYDKMTTSNTGVWRNVVTWADAKCHRRRWHS
jgi:hypothetical protein